MSYISVHWLILALNTSLQVSLLAAIAMLLLRVFKVHDSNLRHRAWTGVLVGMLALPAFARLGPPVGLPVSIEEQLLAAQRWFDEANEPEAVAEVAVGPPASTT